MFFFFIWVLFEFFKDYIPLLGETIIEEKKQDLLIEVVGLLGNLNVADVDYKMFLEEFKLISWIKSRLKSSNDAV